MKKKIILGIVVLLALAICAVGFLVVASAFPKLFTPRKRRGCILRSPFWTV